LIDGKPIVCVATVSTGNRKTGIGLSTYIMRSDIPPLEALANGDDRSICGDCIHRGDGSPASRSCYVLVFQGPRSVYDAYTRGKYKKADPSKLDKTLPVRLGAYGDPAAVPAEIWRRLVKGAPSWTGYTHSPHVQDLRDLCMASVETVEQAGIMQARGWKTYRTMPQGGAPLHDEVRCPASEEMGHKVTCAQCKLCNGRKKNVVIEIHGAVHLRRRFTLNLEKAQP
jgi:hypothetical protein